MSDVVWLASYPKSGNTWLRMLIGSLTLEADEIDINNLPDVPFLASGRECFESTLLIDSGLLTHDEIDCLRPGMYRQLARDLKKAPMAPGRRTQFVKVHDAYTRSPLGEPLLGGAEAAKGAIVIVRDPRDVAPSFANHNRAELDATIEFLNDPAASLSGGTNRLAVQLSQKLLDWSGHAASWLDQTDLPVHLLRYEDLKRDTAGAMMAAMRFAGFRAAEDEVARAVRLASFANLQEAERKFGFAEWHDRKKERRFFRRGEAGSWRGELTPQQAGRIEARHASMMARLGYPLSTEAKAASESAIR